MKSCVEFFTGAAAITIGVLAVVATFSCLMYVTAYFVSAIITMLGG